MVGTVRDFNCLVVPTPAAVAFADALVHQSQE